MGESGPSIIGGGNVGSILEVNGERLAVDSARVTVVA